MSTIREVNTFDGLESVGDAWRVLHERTPMANFFQSLPWLQAYWRHYGRTQRLRTLLLERHGEIVGILPLVVRKERTKVGSLRFATYPLDYWGSFYGPLGACPEEVLAESVDYLMNSRRDWDVFEPRWVGADGGEGRRVEEVLTSGGLSPLRSALDVAAVAELPDDVPTYHASRTGKWRANRRRWERKLSEAGDVRHERYRPDVGGEPRWDLYDECLRIASASWQGSSTSGTTLTHESVAPFLRDVHEAAARSGGLDMNLLYLNDRAVAFAYNYSYRGNVFGLRIGYDRTFRSGGAGALLCAMAIEDSVRRGDWRYDMGPDNLDHKRQFMSHEMPIYRLSCYRTVSIKQQLLRLKRSIDARAAATLEKIDSLSGALPGMPSPA